MPPTNKTARLGSVQKSRKESSLESLSEESLDKRKKTSCRERLTSVRLKVLIMTFTSMILINSPRFIMPIALTCMNNKTPSGEDPEFDWDAEFIALILLAPYATLWLSPCLGEYLRAKVGSKISMVVWHCASTLLLVLTPEATRLNQYILVGIFALQGLIMAANISVVNSTAAWWCPVNEMVTSMAFLCSGFSVSGILCSLCSGFICLIPFDHGWPFMFYIFGGISLLFIVQWLQIYADSPEDHSFITTRERHYIIASRQGMQHATRTDRPPYRVILTSRPVWGLVLSACCHIWVLWISYSYMPIYFHYALGFTVAESGSMVSAVALLRLCCNFFWAFIQTWISSKGYSTNFVRKLCVLIGEVTGGGLLVLAAYLSTTLNRWTVFALMCSAFAFQSVGASTFTVIPLDMAPRYAGVISIMFTSLASILTIGGPHAVWYLTPTNAVDEWQHVWYMMGGLLLASALVLLLLGDASLQQWAVSPDEAKSGGDAPEPANSPPKGLLSNETMGSWLSNSFSMGGPIDQPASLVPIWQPSSSTFWQYSSPAAFWQPFRESSSKFKTSDPSRTVFTQAKQESEISEATEVMSFAL